MKEPRGTTEKRQTVIRARGALAGVIALMALMASASAVPTGPRFGPFIEPLPEYEGQSTCSPDAKPGVLAFQRMVMRAYPETRSYGISRDCGVGGTSEHKEGRAWDWGVDATKPAEKAQADAMIEWLLKTDRFGNEHAMARRLGVMYIIWNRKIWMPWSGWRVYCEQKAAGCVAPGTKTDVRSPHTDHVHFSFTWDGAMKRRTFWRPAQSLVANVDSASLDASFWSVGRNGSVASSSGGATYGGKGDGILNNPIADIASTATNGGYWLLSRNGRVSSFGDATRKGSVKQKPFYAVAIAGTPSISGYWVAGRGGRVFPFGDAGFFGDLRNIGERVVALNATPSGAGYWLATESGRVAAFGDAAPLGDLSLTEDGVVAMDVSPSGLGYWLATKDGRVAAFGDAGSYGDLAGEPLASPVVAMTATGTGQGYWLVTTHGRIEKFGDARSADARFVTRSAVPLRTAGEPDFLPRD